MKNKKYVVLFNFAVLLFSLYNRANAQIEILHDELQIDQIAILKNSGKTSKATFTLSGTPAGLVAAFGKPLGITNEYVEIDAVNHNHYKYNGAEFAFYKNLLVYFRITNTNFIIRTQTPAPVKEPDKFYFKIGDPVKRVQTIYPKSFKYNQGGRLFFGLYKLTTDPKTGITARTRYDTSFLFFFKDGILTDINYED